MPTYLLHGFRWNRVLVRIFTVEENLDDVAPDWLMGATTSGTLKACVRSKFPDVAKALLPGRLRFIEQHDPTDEFDTGQPFAYVADAVHEVRLGVDLEEEREKMAPDAQRWDAITALRDAIAPGEKVGWFVVVCGDVERTPPVVAPRTIQSLDLSFIEEEVLRARAGSTADDKTKQNAKNQTLPLSPVSMASPTSVVSPVFSTAGEDTSSNGTSLTHVESNSEESVRPKSRSGTSIKNFILRKTKSARDLRRSSSSHNTKINRVMDSPPPVPQIRV